MRSWSSKLWGMVINSKHFALLACVKCGEVCFYPSIMLPHDKPRIYGGGNLDGAGEHGRWVCCACLHQLRA